MADDSLTASGTTGGPDRPRTVVESYFATLSPALLRGQAEDALAGGERVLIGLVLDFAALSHPKVRVSSELRELGHEFYRPLVKRWKEQNPDLRPTLLPGLQAFILLNTRQRHTGPQIDPPAEAITTTPDQRFVGAPTSISVGPVAAAPVGARPQEQSGDQKLFARTLGRFLRPVSRPPPDGVTINLQPLADPGFDWSEGQRLLIQIDALGENVRFWIHHPDERRLHLERVYGLAFQLLKAVEMEFFRRVDGDPTSG